MITGNKSNILTSVDLVHAPLELGGIAMLRIKKLQDSDQLWGVVGRQRNPVRFDFGGHEESFVFEAIDYVIGFHFYDLIVRNVEKAIKGRWTTNGRFLIVIDGQHIL